MENDCLSHYGIMGQKWGIRRYQNSDGTLTEAGRKHYGRILSRQMKNRIDKEYKNNPDFANKVNNMKRLDHQAQQQYAIDFENWRNGSDYKTWTIISSRTPP